MSNNILKWLGDGRVGMSSKTIALTALGQMPSRPSYPHDPDDLSRCYTLLEVAPEAKAGLDHLGVHGGPVWVALVKHWDEIKAAYDHDRTLSFAKDRAKFKCYDLMKSIMNPIEDAERSVIRTAHGTIHL